MFFQQFYLGCLAHASYLIGSEGVAAVIDPQRDVDRYLDEARAAGLDIRYVIETHIHADFVSGHRELAERTGATILIGARAGASFAHRSVSDGERIELGAVELRFFETPGHTPEGISILAVDRSEPETPGRLFTGDTLFIGDVGRPDLAGGKGFTPAQMAAMLYDSLHGKLLALDDRTEVYPAHGAGSLCGRNISKETMSTLGVQRATNYALAPMSKDAFVAMMTAALPDMPAYFALDAEQNRSGAQALDTIARPLAMSPHEVARAQAEGALVLDVRPSEAYGPRHLRGALNIGLDGQFASWAGTLLAFDRPLILVATEEADVDEAVTRLARVGLATARGFLRGGIDAWLAAGSNVLATPQLSIDDFAQRTGDGTAMQLVDVRRPGEFSDGSAPGARSIPLANLARSLDLLDPQAPTIVICGSGYRSSIATSLLEAAGFANLSNVDGGMNAYVERGYPVVVPAAV